MIQTQKINTLIVGQGIAGTLAAFMLHKKNISFAVMDPGSEKTSSLVAAGMFTPISGKRKTIAPLTLQQIPFAINVYKELEVLLNTNILHLENIYHIFTSPAERDDLVSKSAQAEFQNLIIPDPGLLSNLKQEHGAAEILASGWVDCAALVLSFRTWLLEHHAFIQEAFNHDLFRPGQKSMQYGELGFENIVFCEGYQGMENRLFAREQIVPCKGDVLTLSANDFQAKHILKKAGIYLVPLKENIFKAGATYRWHEKNVTPEAAGRQEIEDKLDQMLEIKYTILEHQSAIRPTTQTREVICSQHAVYNNVFMLNGLGTKGILQGPWFANQLIEKYFCWKKMSHGK